MDASTVTLVAALIAAAASILSLLLRSRSELRAELREINRKKLESLVDDLGDAMHKLVACSTLRVRDKEDANIGYWDSKIHEARTSLRKIRPRVRYQLWGLDEGLKALIVLPDWLNPKPATDLSQLLGAAHRLRETLDQSIRLCYRQGRTPTLLDRWRVAQAANALYAEATLLGYSRDDAFVLREPDSSKSNIQHPKNYALVIEVTDEDFVVDLGNSQTARVRRANRSGKGSRSALSVGTKVKVYRRDGEDFLRYRFIGG